MKKRTRKKKRGGAPLVRLPLPGRTEKRHGDATKYSRAKQKERLKKELER